MRTSDPAEFFQRLIDAYPEVLADVLSVSGSRQVLVSEVLKIFPESKLDAGGRQEDLDRRSRGW